MKIAFLLQHYFPYGGLQRDCLTLAQIMHSRGHSVHIMTRRWDGEVPEGIQTHELGARGHSNLAMDRNFSDDVTHLLDETGRWDCIIGFSRLMAGLDFYYAADPCYQLRIRRDRSWFYRYTPRFKWGAELERHLFANGGNARIFLLTDMELNAYQDFYATEQNRLLVLPPSIKRRDLSVQEKLDLRERVRMRMNWDADSTILLFVGSGFETKGLDRAIQALSDVSQDNHVQLYVAGTGKTGRYERLASKLGVADSVSFLGGRDDAWELMVAADLMIHPARSENTGTVLVEALSAGTGVMTTDRCGFASHIQSSGAGAVLESPFNRGSFARKLHELIGEDWQKRSESALQYAECTDLYSGMETAADHLERFLHDKSN